MWVPDIEKFNIQQMGVIFNSLKILIKHMMSIQAKKLQNVPVTKYHINNIDQLI